MIFKFLNNQTYDIVQIWAGFGSLYPDSPPVRFLRQAKKPQQPQPPPQPSLKVQMFYPKVMEMPRTSFTCGKLKGKMVPDKEANCQVTNYFTIPNKSNQYSFTTGFYKL